MGSYITSTEYTVLVYRYNDGAFLGYITDFSSLAIAKTVNAYDTFQMEMLYGTEGSEYLVTDAVVRVFRQNTLLNIPSTLEFEGLVVRTVITEAETNTLMVTAFGFEHILTRRIIAWKDNQLGKTTFPESPTAGFEYASSIIRKLYNTNVGSGATSTREDITNVVGTARIINGHITPWFNDYTDTSNFGLAISSIEGIARENLLETIQSIAEEGKIGFNITWQPSPSRFTFNMKAFRLGADRTDTVKFSIGTGTVASIETSTDYTQTWNVAMMSGGGTGSSEKRFVLAPEGRYSGIAQREIWLTSATGTINGNRATAIAEYYKMKRLIKQVTCEVQQSQGLMYGRDYFLSDLVSVDTIAGTVELQVKTVTLSISSEGIETIGVTLESE
jgi:hypothetical protein